MDKQIENNIIETAGQDGSSNVAFIQTNNINEDHSPSQIYCTNIESSTAVNNHNNNNNNNINNNRDLILQQQRTRIIQLRHASKCSRNENCPVYSNCSILKLLWEHILICKDSECKEKWCISSRWVFSHYAKCRDIDCSLCGPLKCRCCMKKRFPDLNSELP